MVLGIQYVEQVVPPNLVTGQAYLYASSPSIFYLILAFLYRSSSLGDACLQSYRHNWYTGLPAVGLRIVLGGMADPR
ncbi:hypothetical protein D3C72_2169130 [compost metagenome]